jgi:hypothetical protein
MKVEQSQVTKLKITDVESLDSLHVFVEDIGERAGKVTMETSSESWSAYWGGCGTKGVVKFFLRCNNDYLVNCFERGIRSEIDDYDKLNEWFKSSIIEQRKDNDLDKEPARELWDEVELWCENDERFLQSDRGQELAHKVIGDEWWYTLPTSENGEYAYLIRIVQAMREAFTVISTEAAA